VCQKAVIFKRRTEECEIALLRDVAGHTLRDEISNFISRSELQILYWTEREIKMISDRKNSWLWHLAPMNPYRAARQGVGRRDVGRPRRKIVRRPRKIPSWSEQAFGTTFTLMVVMLHIWFMFGIRPVGTPKKRWMDAVKEDSCQILKWRNWDVKAQDRDEWRSRIKKAKTRFGLQCHWWWRIWFS
jgi:hypothetical protein